jgi:hypothetical protein
MFAILTVVILSVFRAVLLSWSSEEARVDIDIGLDTGIEKMVRELREAIEVQSAAEYNEIRFTVEENGLNVSYIFYFYNENDSYLPPPAFDRDSYELRKAVLAGGINGTFDYGDGLIIITGITSPSQGTDPKTELSIDADNLINIVIKITEKDDIITSKTQVKPRGL